eukprot:TRINITY_DN407_c0_g1_i2.p1 TRINITY_DN407_c0_g1~~TRINITY_DN407_c0_g1_i2.p1  ORF type:complete len:179 (+),score=13.45 TRINITY_DN407_c0_g1_i2:344-880(+)
MATSEVVVDESEMFRRKPGLMNSPTFEPKITKSVPAPKLGKIKREKFSSTATMFMNRNILSLDVESTLKSLSIALHFQLKNHEAHSPRVEIDIFSEHLHPLGDDKIFTKTPEIHEINEFLYLIFKTEEFPAECAVLALAYIERLITLTKITLHSSNWRRICLGAVILATKGIYASSTM